MTRRGDQASERISAKSSVALLRYSIATLVIGALATLLVLGAVVPEASINFLGPFMVLLVALVGGYCLSRGRIDIAIQILAYGVCVAITGIAAFTGGVRSPVIVVYPVIILVFGWLTNRSAVIRITITTVMLAIGLWAAESWGLQQNAQLSPPSIYILHQLFTYGLSAVLIVFMLRAYNRRVQELDTLSADLAEYTHLLEQNTDLLERAQTVARVGSWVADIPANLISPSAEGCQILGIAPGADLSYEDYMSRVHEDDRAAIAKAWRAALKDGFFDEEHRIVVKGVTQWVRQKAELEFDPQGKPVSAMGITQDITERKLTQLALWESEKRYRTLIEWSPQAILVHRMGTILYANPSAIKLFGAPDKQTLLSKSTSELIHPDYRESQNQRMQNIYKGEAIPPSVKSRFLKLDGTMMDVEVQGTAIEYDGAPAIHVSIWDITERKRMEDEIKQLAFYDALTGLPNRRLLNDRLNQAISTNRRNGGYNAVMFLDLDNFKPLNDNHGHAVGDMLLVQAAARIKACVREMDTVARFGGDEFVVLLTELDNALPQAELYANNVATKIITALAAPYHLQIQLSNGAVTPLEHHCTASIGLVVYNDTKADPDELIKWADAAMYQAKDRGRNQVALSGENSVHP
jgi:diguanylate cyclase (GGDEF)-like protein/PAS domain S-box-containing protein